VLSKHCTFVSEPNFWSIHLQGNISSFY